KLRPAFAPDGTATAGNASQISDGAAAVIVTRERIAGESKTGVKTPNLSSAVHSRETRDPFTPPIRAIPKGLDQATLQVPDIDPFELNEAFAGQCLACVRPLGIDPAKLNVHGGAIALGHPIGASGARILVTLLHALAARQLRYGLAALCLGGGESVAMIVER